MKKTVLGIAGYIGSGKTLAGKFFEELGAEFIDADKVVDDIYQKGKGGYRKIVDYFGNDFLDKDGEIDRGKIAKFVFGNPKKLEILNNLIHPLVAHDVQKRIDASNAQIIVIEAIYFKPKSLGKLVDKILWISCRKDVLAKRVLKRPGINEELFEKILDSQVKPEKVDFVVKNNDSVGDFEKDLIKVWDAADTTSYSIHDSLMDNP